MSHLWWDDGEGTRGVSNRKIWPASRFNDWKPVTRSVGASAYALGTGARHQFEFRAQYGATFRLDHITRFDLENFAALSYWLEAGGTVQVDTEDDVSTVYPNCCLMDGADPPAVEQTDAGLREYSATFALVNLDGAPMVAYYDFGADNPVILLP